MICYKKGRKLNVKKYIFLFSFLSQINIERKEYLSWQKITSYLLRKVQLNLYQSSYPCSKAKALNNQLKYLFLFYPFYKKEVVLILLLTLLSIPLTINHLPNHWQHSQHLSRLTLMRLPNLSHKQGKDLQ